MAFSRPLQLDSRGERVRASAREQAPLVRDQALAKNGRRLALFPRPVRRSRSREDFLDFCLVGGKLSLQVCTQKRKPVISPKDLVVHHKGWDTEYPGLNCTFRLKTKPFFDFNRLGLAQKLFSIEADAISNLANDGIRGDISSLTPGSIKKSHRKAFSKTIIVAFSGLNGCAGGLLNFNPRWMAQRCVSRIV